MSNSELPFVKLQQELQKAMSTIEASSGLTLPQHRVVESTEFPMAQSLLARCEELVKKNKIKNRPTLRVLQHFACSGGTLVSKCFAALPNVFLLSESHPTSRLHMGEGKAKFLPSDIASQARYANIPHCDELANTLFKNSIIETANHTERLGGHLLIREHSHSDYCVGQNVSSQPSVVELLDSEFTVLRLATIRDPIDAFHSLSENKWFHFEPYTFEEYCQRFLKFINPIDDENIIRYEDFVAAPMEQMQIMSRILALPFDESFIDTFSLFRVSGDSGRSGTKIEPRPRKTISDAFKKEIEESESYYVIATKFGYNSKGVEND